MNIIIRACEKKLRPRATVKTRHQYHVLPIYKDKFQPRFDDTPCNLSVVFTPSLSKSLLSIGETLPNGFLKVVGSYSPASHAAASHRFQRGYC